MERKLFGDVFLKKELPGTTKNYWVPQRTTTTGYHKELYWVPLKSVMAI